MAKYLRRTGPTQSTKDVAAIGWRKYLLPRIDAIILNY